MFLMAATFMILAASPPRHRRRTHTGIKYIAWSYVGPSGPGGTYCNFSRRHSARLDLPQQVRVRVLVIVHVPDIG